MFDGKLRRKGAAGKIASDGVHAVKIKMGKGDEINFSQNFRHTSLAREDSFSPAIIVLEFSIGGAYGNVQA